MICGLHRFSCRGDVVWHDPDEIVAALISDGWMTADTYGRDYVPAPEGPGVYLFLAHTMPGYEKAVLAYVGMSKNVAKRAYSQHSVKESIYCEGLWPMVWFKSCQVDELRDLERSYIRALSPPLNIAGLRPRIKGVDREAAH